MAGTSCSTPISASIVALLNDELIAAGKGPLGFLNPLLYANPGALNDITTGELIRTIQLETQTDTFRMEVIIPVAAPTDSRLA